MISCVFAVNMPDHCQTLHVLLEVKWKLRLHESLIALQLIQMILSEFKHIETFLESSAKNQQSIPDIFYYAVKSVIHPAEPLVEFHTAALKPLCVKALKRVFLLCDANQVRGCCNLTLNYSNVKQ